MKYKFLVSQKVDEIIQEIKRIKSFTIISICGGSCVGKTTLANYFYSLGLGNILPMDAFYKPIPDINEFLPGIPAFDSPDAFDFALLNTSINNLRKGFQIEIPVYNYSNTKIGRDESRTSLVIPTKVIFLDGILSYHEDIKLNIDFGIFIERDQNKCLLSRIKKDIAERGVTEERSREIYINMTVPLYKKYVESQKYSAKYILENK